MTDSRVRSPWAESDPLLTSYYDTEWGLPVFDEHELFERLTLEAFQSGLSWLTILRKRDAFREAFSRFDPVAVAAYGEPEIARLLENSNIIRNRAKIIATIGNARAIVDLPQVGVTLADIVWSFMPERSPQPRSEAEVPSTSPESVALAHTLKTLGFRFVGPTTAYALMTATGVADVHLVQSHRRGCSGLWRLDGVKTEAGETVAAQAAAATSTLFAKDAPEHSLRLVSPR